MAQDKKIDPGTIDRREMLLRLGTSSAALMIPACASDKGDESVNTNPSGSTQTQASNTTAATSATPGASSAPAATSATPGSSSATGNASSAPAATSAPAASSQPQPMTSDTSGGGSGGTGGTGPEPSASTTAEPSGGAGGEGGTPDAGGSGGGDAGTGGGGDMEVPPWDDVPMCTASLVDAQGQGPFFIHELEIADDVSLFRQDIRGKFNASSPDGIEMQLHIRVLDSTSDACNQTPVENVEVYIWHTDAEGYYSGFGNDSRPQNPDEPYAGVPNAQDLLNSDRFCRGAQTTNAEGVVSFRSVFPGWYNGRDVHIHVVVFRPGSESEGRATYSGGNHVFTTQLYFQKEFTDSVHKSAEPYLSRTTIAPYYDQFITPDQAASDDLICKGTRNGEIVVAQMQLILDPEASVGPQGF